MAGHFLLSYVRFHLGRLPLQRRTNRVAFYHFRTQCMRIVFRFISFGLWRVRRCNSALDNARRRDTAATLQTV